MMLDPVCPRVDVPAGGDCFSSVYVHCIRFAAGLVRGTGSAVNVTSRPWQVAPSAEPRHNDNQRTCCCLVDDFWRRRRRHRVSLG